MLFRSKMMKKQYKLVYLQNNYRVQKQERNQ